MGTFALFSSDYCATKSTCVLIDAWLQLFLCIVTVIVLAVLCDALTGCCSRRQCKSREADDTYSEGSMIRRVLGKARYPASRRRFWNNTDSKTLPLPRSVIKKDARSAQIMSHKNSHKHGAHFMKQTQRMSRGGLAAMQLGRKSTTQPVHKSDTPNTVEGSFLGPTRTGISRQESGNGASKKVVVVRSGETSPKSSAMLPRSLRHGSRDDTGNNLSTGALQNRSSSFRKRLVSVFTPPDFFVKKNAQLQHQNSLQAFDIPTYEMKHELAELSPDDHLENERRSSMKLRDKRRLSIATNSQLQFQVGADKASVYEVKLQEINLVKRLAFGPLSEVYAAI